MRINEKLQVQLSLKLASLILSYQLVFILASYNINAFSISSNGNSKNSITGVPVARSNQQQVAASLLTTQSPLIPTSNHNSYTDSHANQLHLKQPAGSQEVGATNGEQRSASVEEHEDTMPLATINNHSRNNQQPNRPPQYVDVSALVGVSLA